jgi:hypothetical protein
MMKRILLNILHIGSKVNSESISNHIYNLLYGFIGLFSFLTVIIIAKVFSILTSTGRSISIDELDIILSLLGFVMIYVYKEFENKGKN